MQEVLTPLAAAALFGKSGEAVRLAARLGHVHAPVSFYLGSKEIRCIDLQSAIGYWNGGGHKNIDADLEEMRFYGVTISDSSGLSYKVLTPFAAMQ